MFTVPTAARARAQIVDLLTSYRSRPAALVSSVSALCSTWSLPTIDAATFGFYDRAAGAADVVATAGSATITSDSDPWTSADVGRSIAIAGAGAGAASLSAVILEVTAPGAATLDRAAVTAQASTVAVWGDEVAEARRDVIDQGDGDMAAAFAVRATGSILARQLSDRFRDRVSVLDYGADPTGLDDATGAVIAAIGAGGRTVYFPPGEYRIGTTGASDGINILFSHVVLEFAGGARLKKYGSGGTITIARAPLTTVEHVTIRGGHISPDSVAVANAGVVISPDIGNVARHITIDGLVTEGMSQYGIVGGGEMSDITITKCRLVDTGTGAGEWTSQSLILFPKVAAGVSKRLVVSDCYIGQVTAVASAETDASKLQRFDSVMLSNTRFEGGGSTTVTGACLVLDDNHAVMASGLHFTGTNGAGLIVQNQPGDRAEINGAVFDGSFGSEFAVYFGSNGGHNIAMRNLHTSAAISAGAGSFDRIEVSNCIADRGIDFSSATDISNSVMKGNVLRDKIYIKGDANIINDNIFISVPDYAVRVSGDGNIIDGNNAVSPAVGHIQIVGGVGNLIGVMRGDMSIVDAGTATRRSAASVPMVGGIGYYVDGDATPDVTGINFLRVTNTGATTITNLDGGVIGQQITLLFGDGNTTIDRSNALLSGGANFTASADDTMVLVKGPSYWHEVSRSVNA